MQGGKYHFDLDAFLRRRRWAGFVLMMEKDLSDVENVARMRGLLHSESSLKRSTSSRPIPKANSRSRVSPGPSDAGMRKRVKFSGSTIICEPEEIRNRPLPQNEGANLSYSDGAKTSEFKSFKRLLEKTAHTHYSDKVAKSDIKLKKGKARDCMEASSNAIPSKSNVRRSSFPVQNVSSIVQGFLSSPTQVSQKQEFKNKAKENNGAARSVPFSTCVDRLFYPSPPIIGKICGGKHLGPMQEHKGTFKGKRARLLELATGACLQNVDDLLSNRSDFILDILQRLGIGRNENKHEKSQNPEQKMDAHQFPASSKRSNQIVKFCDDSQENSCAYKTEQYDNLLALKWDNTEIQAFPFIHSFETNFDCKNEKSYLFTEKTATVLPNFDNPASAIDLSYTDKTHARLNSPFDISEVNAFPIDCTNMGQPYKNLHSNSALEHKKLFDLSVTKDKVTSWNSKLQLYCSNHGPHRRNHDSFQADCILPNSYNSESFFQELALAPYMHPELSREQFNLDKELAAPEYQELDQSYKSLYDTLDFQSEIGSSSFFDVYGRKSFKFFTETQF